MKKLIIFIIQIKKKNIYVTTVTWWSFSLTLRSLWLIFGCRRWWRWLLWDDNNAWVIMYEMLMEVSWWKYQNVWRRRKRICFYYAKAMKLMGTWYENCEGRFLMIVHISEHATWLPKSCCWALKEDPKWKLWWCGSSLKEEPKWKLLQCGCWGYCDVSY